MEFPSESSTSSEHTGRQKARRRKSAQSGSGKPSMADDRRAANTAAMTEASDTTNLTSDLGTAGRPLRHHRSLRLETRPAAVSADNSEQPTASHSASTLTLGRDPHRDKSSRSSEVADVDRRLPIAFVADTESDMSGRKPRRQPMSIKVTALPASGGSEPATTSHYDWTSSPNMDPHPVSNLQVSGATHTLENQTSPWQFESMTKTARRRTTSAPSTAGYSGRSEPQRQFWSPWRQRTDSSQSAQRRLGAPPPASLCPQGAQSARSGVRVPPKSHFHQPSPVTPSHVRPLFPLLGIGVCLLFVFSVVVALVVLLPGPYRPPLNMCSTIECHEFGRQLRSSINLSADPCHNFTRFVCSGWERRNELSVREKFYERALELMTRNVRTVPVNETNQNSVQQAAAIFRSCETVMEGKSDQLEDVRKALLEAGIVWPRFPSPVDVVSNIMYCSLKLGWDAVLRVDIRLSDEKTSLLINPGRSFTYIMHRRHAVRTTGFEQYFNVLRSRFGGGGSSIDDSLLEFTVRLEEYVQRALSDAYNARTEEQILADGGLLGLGVERWEHVFTELNPTLRGPLELLTTADDFVKTFLTFWDNEGEFGAHVYTSWCTVQVAALYSNRELVMNYYGSFSRARVYHRAFCATKAYAFSPYALLERYHVELLSGKARVEAERIVRSVGDVFMRRLSQWSHLKGNITVVENWSSLSRAFQGFDRGHDRGLIGYDMNDSLVANWQKSTLLPSIPEDYILVPAIESLELFALFFRERAFQLMPVSVYFPFFDLGLTTAINYGGVGAIGAAALGRLFLHAHGSDDANGERTVACVHSGSDAVEATVLALTAGALIEAYRSYGKAGLQPYPPKLQRFNAAQLVLMTLCFARCEGSDFGNGAQICDFSLRHVKEFAEVFQCAPYTPMNPIRRCDIP